MWCLWCCKQVLCLWPENNGFRLGQWSIEFICDQNNHWAAFGHNNIAAKRKQMKMRENEYGNKSDKNSKKKAETKHLSETRLFA